ncbi:hypothetical protein B0T16DRAFT_220853 [Cercophora newfieldiana]|uniref:Uncharacterized protein n=1 Tax=Cercophora newfieldiana TaxID=92897 RepID=A0AA40CLW5_9PEZI|nr:hypothetical protein B0T16DRAFT_220853 [Cercophora newfieldiana]
MDARWMQPTPEWCLKAAPSRPPTRNRQATGQSPSSRRERREKICKGGFTRGRSKGGWSQHVPIYVMRPE